ncbi:hypothetical protein PHISCL_02115 [Aspergillus sclerotialis]|uniref:Uncharacterized protein n=1 Tax=Aspergillus sclerotialis TaxID=2070753 RepID=A0A3A3A6G0_9EURO|nr:hypothetical protein PHISCL_02115 [Aspergillus sclerotialis]
MAQQSSFRGTSADASTLYQPSAQRTFPTHKGFEAMDVEAAQMASYHSPNGFQAPYNGTPVASDSSSSIPNALAHTSFSAVGLNNPSDVYQERPHPCTAPGTFNNAKPLESTGHAPVRHSHSNAGGRGRNTHQSNSQRRPHNRDGFENRHQYLRMPSPRTIKAQAAELPQLPTNLDASEQDHILNAVNDRLSQCVFDFVAKYQFPIPLERDKREVQCPSDREWTEWVQLLKKLATKRRIPADILYNGQIKQLITILESSLEMRHAAKHQSRPIKDDRNVLQLISAGTQVAKILQDATAMNYLNCLYVETERIVYERQSHRVYSDS